jgi:hypothetical protein
MPNEPASSLQEGGTSNLLVAEVSVDGLNLLDGPALGGQVSSAGLDFSICSCLARGELGISSSITVVVSFLQDWNLLGKQCFSGISCGTGNISLFTGCCFFCLGVCESGIRLGLLGNQVVVTEGHGCDGACLLSGASCVLGVLLVGSLGNVGITVCG